VDAKLRSAVSLTRKAFKRAVVLKGLKWVNRTKKKEAKPFGQLRQLLWQAHQIG